MTRIVPLTALSIGYRVSQEQVENRRYRVHSRFRHALNLTCGDGELLTLLDMRYENTPSAIRIAAPAGWDWRDCCVADQPVVRAAGALSGEGWTVALARAVRWEPEPLGVPPAALPGSEHCAVLAAELRRYASEHGLRSELQLLPGWPASARAVSLALDGDVPRLRQQVARLVGFGTGLTPDGDDFLLGYLAALTPWLDLEAIALHHALMKQLIGAQLHRTTDISRHYLKMAMQGHFSQPLNSLMAAIGRSADWDEIRYSALRVMQVGSTSGVDSLAGVIAGIHVLPTGQCPVISFN
jgi:hypothetical protein